MLDVGSLYTIYNGNLLFHACVPLNPDGSLKEVDVFGTIYKGRALFDIFDQYVQRCVLQPRPWNCANAAKILSGTCGSAQVRRSSQRARWPRRDLSGGR